MSIFAIVANIINKILSFSLFPKLPALSLPGDETTSIEVNPSKRDDFSSTLPAEQRGASEHGTRGTQGSNRCPISVPEVINPNARFFSKGSGAWVNQWQGLVIDGVDMHGRHGGTDFTGAQGTSVYAPFDLHSISIGHYNDVGRFGDYIVGTTPDGLEYYSGHLDNIEVQSGQDVTCGTKLGVMNVYNHTHVQIKRNGTIIDPESVLK